MARTLLIDTNNLAYRAAYSHKALWSGDTFTGLFYGVFSMINAYMKQIRPDHVVFVSDRIVREGDAPGVRSAWRVKYQTDYKNRASKRNPEQEKNYQAIQRQLPTLRSALQCMPCYWFEQDLMEADDLIGWLVTDFFTTTENIIISTDKDLIQLVSNNTSVYYPGAKKQVWITASDFPQQAARFVEHNKKLHPSDQWLPPTPAAWLDYKCCLGDNGDNIEGLKGIGAKWAWEIAKAGGYASIFTSDIWADKKGKKYDYMRSEQGMLDYMRADLLSRLPSPYAAEVAAKSQTYHGQYPGNYPEFARWCNSLGLEKIKHGLLPRRAHDGVATY